MPALNGQGGSTLRPLQASPAAPPTLKPLWPPLSCRVSTQRLCGTNPPTLNRPSHIPLQTKDLPSCPVGQDSCSYTGMNSLRPPVAVLRWCQLPVCCGAYHTAVGELVLVCWLESCDRGGAALIACGKHTDGSITGGSPYVELGRQVHTKASHDGPARSSGCLGVLMAGA